MLENINITIKPIFLLYSAFGALCVLFLLLIAAWLRNQFAPLYPYPGPLPSRPTNKGSSILYTLAILLIVLLAVLYLTNFPSPPFQSDIPLSKGRNISIASLDLSTAETVLYSTDNQLDKPTSRIEFIDLKAPTRNIERNISPSLITSVKKPIYTLQFCAASNKKNVKEKAIYYAKVLGLPQVYLYQEGSLTKIFIGLYSEKAELELAEADLASITSIQPHEVSLVNIAIGQLVEIKY